MKKFRVSMAIGITCLGIAVGYLPLLSHRLVKLVFELISFAAWCVVYVIVRPFWFFASLFLKGIRHGDNDISEKHQDLLYKVKGIYLEILEH